jgi:hypothetical protein
MYTHLHAQNVGTFDFVKLIRRDQKESYKRCPETGRAYYFDEAFVRDFANYHERNAHLRMYIERDAERVINIYQQVEVAQHQANAGERRDGLAQCLVRLKKLGLNAELNESAQQWLEKHQ